MRVLVAHNKYRNQGGEDAVVEQEIALLAQHGHVVEFYTRSNAELGTDGSAGMKVALGSIWNPGVRRELSKLVRAFTPDVVHVHNTFALLSPATIWGAGALGAPVVQTLHNYRLTCANAQLFRNGAACERCVGHLPLPALRFRCYRGSLRATSAVVASQLVHRVIGTYRRAVSAHIVLTEFARRIMVRAGLPMARVFIKPNFVADPLAGLPREEERRARVLYVGRLVHEKGVDLLLDAWKRRSPSGWELRVIGDGPEREFLQGQISNRADIKWLGWISRQAVTEELKHGNYLVLPSRWYEGLPLVVLEALAAGTPVIAPRWGGVAEVVEDGLSGALFEPLSVDSLVDTLDRCLSRTSAEWLVWSRASRAAFESRYAPEKNYATLIGIYERVLKSGRRSPSTSGT